MADDDDAAKEKDANKAVKAMIKDDIFGLRTYRCNAPPVDPYDGRPDVSEAQKILNEIFAAGTWRIDGCRERKSTNHDVIVADLAENGKDSKYATAACEHTGITALHACAINGYLSLMRNLVEFGHCDPLDVAEHLADFFDKRIEKARGADALWMAKRRGHRDCVDYLLSLTVVQDALGTTHLDARALEKMAKAEELKRRELFVKNARGLGRRVEDRRDRERVRSRSLAEGVRVSLIKDGEKGTVRYVGPVDYTRGTMVGLELDRDTRGKHNGSVKGKEYFKCEPRFGIMVQPSDVQLDDVDYAVMAAVDTLPSNPLPAIDYFPSKVVDEKRRLSRMTMRKSSFSGVSVADRLMGRGQETASTRAYRDARGAQEMFSP